jgi:hypothetical protein
LYNRPEVAAVPSGLSPTPLRKEKKKKKKQYVSCDTVPTQAYFW